MPGLLSGALRPMCLLQAPEGAQHSAVSGMFIQTSDPSRLLAHFQTPSLLRSALLKLGRSMPSSTIKPSGLHSITIEMLKTLQGLEINGEPEQPVDSKTAEMLAR